MLKHQLSRLVMPCLIVMNAPVQAGEVAAKIQPSYKAKSQKEAVAAYNTGNATEINLSPLTVTSSSTVQDELLSPKSVSIYTKDDIGRSGVTSLLDFFKNYTEIQIDPNFGNILNPQFSLRGFGNTAGFQNTTVIVDGVSLNRFGSAATRFRTGGFHRKDRGCQKRRRCRLRR